MATNSLAETRAAFAAQLEQESGVDDPRLIDAFATLPREDFLGPGPWRSRAGA